MVVYSQIQIDGTALTNNSDLQVIKSTSQNNASSNFKASMINYAGSFAADFTVGQTVEVFADLDVNPPTTKIFSGILEDIKYDGKENNEKITLAGKDFTTRLIDRTVEPEVYNSLPAGSIVKDIISKYVDDITVNNVQDTTTTIDRITFNQTPVFDAIRTLAEQSDSVFYIDNDKDLHFGPKSETSSNLTFNNTNVTQAYFKEKRDSVFNEIWVYGDRYLDGFDETFTGTGSTSDYVLINQPHNTKITVNSVTQKGGIANMITPSTVSGVDYTVDLLSRTIAFQSGTDIGYDATPGVGSTVFIDYKRELPIVKVGKDNDSIAAYGKRIKMITDKNIRDPQTAQQLLASELAENSVPAKEGNLKIKGVVNVTPSETCVVNIPFHNVDSATYDILEAKYKFNDVTQYKEDVLELKVNKKLPDASDTIKQMLLDIKKIQGQDISDSDILTRFEFTAGSVGVQHDYIRVRDNYLGSGTSFILGKGPHGITGSTFGGILGSVVASGINFLGDDRGGLTDIIVNNFGEYVEDFNTTDFKSFGTAAWGTTGSVSFTNNQFVVSTSIEKNNGLITKATLTPSEIHGVFSYAATADGGNTDTMVPGVSTIFTNPGSNMYWLIACTSASGAISQIKIDGYT